jgi:hypothetical protein
MYRNRKPKGKLNSCHVPSQGYVVPKVVKIKRGVTMEEKVDELWNMGQ